MKNTIKLLIIIGLLYSCKKDTEPIEKTITLTGKIVKNCTGTPMANRDIEIWLQLPNIDFEILNATTDANGNFSWTFERPDNLIQIALRPAGMGDIITFEPKHRNLGTIIATPTCNVVMKIKVNNPYNSEATLELKDFVNYPSNYHQITGPFKDTIFQTGYSYSQLRWPDTFEQKNTTFVSSDIYI